MLATPALTPVTVPLTDPTDAIRTSEVPQSPPAEAILAATDCPTHTAPGNEMRPGEARTVTVATEIQPPGSVYVMTDVPAAIAVTVPDRPSIAAITGELLLHTPPTGRAESVPVSPMQ